MGPSKKRCFLLALLFFSIIMPAQTLPQLPVDSHIRKGTLRCGVHYYLVTNPTVKGYADLAVVRLGDGTSRSNREMLDSLLNFSSRTPWRFLADNGIGCREEGWVSERGPVTVFRFDNVPCYNEAVQDSTLLLSFNLIGESLTDQAIIVAGDIKAQDIVDKMDIFSLSLLSRYDSAGQAEELREPADTAVSRFFPSADTLIATVRVSYLAPRTLPEYKNTAQPLVSENFYDEMGVVIRHRLEPALRRHGFPFSDIRYRHVGSDRSAGPERHEVSVVTDRYHVQAVGSVIALTLSALKDGGVSPEEFAAAKGTLFPGMTRLGNRTRFSNADYIEKCQSAFLYGGDLAPFKERVSLFARNLPAETEAGLYNSITGPLMERKSRLVIDYTALPDSIYSLDPVDFHAVSWDAGAGDPAWTVTTVGVRKDTSSWAGPAAKTKLKKTAPDAMTGGELWTFANGMQVLFKKMGPAGCFSYALFVKGGYNAVPDLLPGEGAYFSDLLRCFDVADMRGPDFFATLAAGGVEMVPSVTATGMSLAGMAPYNKLELTLSALLSIATRRSYNPDTVKQYLDEEAFRLKATDPSARLCYEAVFPNYRLLPYKDPERLGNALARKAEKYFNDRFQNCQDGMLVICGDLPAETVKKLVTQYIGGFRTGGSTMVRHSAPTVAMSTPDPIRLENGPARARFFLSAPLPYTAANNIAARIALLALERNLVAELAPLGFSVELSGAFTTYPEERFEVEVRCLPARESGLPASFGAPDTALLEKAFRRALGRTALSGTDFNGMKAAVVQMMGDDLTEPDVMVEMVITRYTEGKDLVTRFAEQAKGVTSAQVEAVLKAFAGGCCSEVYVP